MKFPYSIHIGAETVLLHGLFEAIGIFVAFRYYLLIRKKQGDNIPTMNRVWIIIGATLGDVLGARIIGTLEIVPEWYPHHLTWSYFWGNKTLVGGLLGGLAGVETMKKLIKEKHNSGDLFTYPLILGMIIGRIGCFTAGIYEETYGFPTNLPWGMNLGDGIMRHPVTLYEILFLILLWIALKQVQKKYILEQGALFKMFLVSYLVFRLLLDFIKPGWRYFFGLGTIQITCILGLLYYIRYLLKPRLLILQAKAYAR